MWKQGWDSKMKAAEARTQQWKMPDWSTKAKPL